ncbi:TonB-dependent receptor [Tunturiibacter gelidiferens]|uniref:TonB-dependent receptor n=1 Tax=Tunturiibacter gelidiferens TaxID=3069689 RepID=UPI003D9B8BE5
MKNQSAFLTLCVISLSAAVAQQPHQSTDATTSPKRITPIAESITVTTTLEPLPLAESDRSVNLISPRDQPLLSNSVVDLLRQDTSLNLQARAANGVQADLSLRGTTFEQALILLNGLRINDPETGHLNLDIPIPLDAVTRIDILHGSGSTFYGSGAIGGAVNLLTQPPPPASPSSAAQAAAATPPSSSTSEPPTPRAPSPPSSPVAATPPMASSPTATTRATPSPPRPGSP